jgi:hypothetical protein
VGNPLSRHDHLDRILNYCLRFGMVEAVNSLRILVQTPLFSNLILRVEIENPPRPYLDNGCHLTISTQTQLERLSRAFHASAAPSGCFASDLLGRSSTVRTSYSIQRNEAIQLPKWAKSPFFAPCFRCKVSLTAEHFLRFPADSKLRCE